MAEGNEKLFADYTRDGVLVIENAISIEWCERLMARMKELVAGFEVSEHQTVFNTLDQSHAKDAYFMESGDKISFFLEDGVVDDKGALTVPKAHALNKVGHALHTLDPVFKEFSSDPRFKALLVQLGMAAPDLLQSMYIFKNPRVGGEVVCHQDATYLWTEPQTVTGLWFALEDATIENGCLYGIPGAHTEAMPRSKFGRTAPGALSTKTTIFDKTPFIAEDAVPLEVKAGTMVVLHGQFPHLSCANKSDKSRHALALHYVDGAAEYVPDNWLKRST